MRTTPRTEEKTYVELSPKAASHFSRMSKHWSIGLLRYPCTNTGNSTRRRWQHSKRTTRCGTICGLRPGDPLTFFSCQPCRTLLCHTEDADGSGTRSSLTSSITPRSHSPPGSHPRIWTTISPATTSLEMISMPGTGASTILNQWTVITLACKLWVADLKRRKFWGQPNSSSVYWAFLHERMQDNTIDHPAVVRFKRGSIV
jgi:hypothetical protein